ncbi:hypothetical protein SZMC14600_18939 [Saccharomonospora azurea SZMC 14600]|nr:hypothetical protein SZMC14600_18939 [Saccharomonospora azurea SZMC 14600]
MPVSALSANSLSTNDKGLLLILDALARRSTCRASTSTVSVHADLTERQVRRSTTSLTGRGYLARRQTGPRSWEWRLLRRTPATWVPGWTLPWVQMCPDLDLRHLVLYAVVIARTPQGELTEHLAPWCEVSTTELGQCAGISRNHVPSLLDALAAAGLVLTASRPGQPTIVYPTVEPETPEDRADRAECVANILEDRDGPGKIRLNGVDGAFPIDDPALYDEVSRRPVDYLVATGRTRTHLRLMEPTL